MNSVFVMLLAARAVRLECFILCISTRPPIVEFFIILLLTTLLIDYPLVVLLFRFLPRAVLQPTFLNLLLFSLPMCCFPV